MTKSNYDFVFSLGAACSCAQTLERAGFRYASYPFDWLYGSTIVKRAEMIRDRFPNWMDPSIMELVETGSDKPHDVYRNKVTDIVFNHDFKPAGSVDFQQEVVQVREKYGRRIQRLYYSVERAKRVLILFIQTPIDTVLEDDQIQRSYSILKSIWPDKELDMLVFSFEKGRNMRERIVRCPSPNVTRIYFDYQSRGAVLDLYAYAADFRLLAKCLREHIGEITDYRTPEQRRAFAIQARIKRYERFGAKSLIGYLFRKYTYKIKNHFNNARIRRGGIVLPSRGRGVSS